MTVQAILRELRKQGTDLKVKKPGSVVGSVLNAMPELEREGQGTFRSAQVTE